MIAARNLAVADYHYFRGLYQNARRQGASREMAALNAWEALRNEYANTIALAVACGLDPEDTDVAAFRRVRDHRRQQMALRRARRAAQR